MEWLHSARGLQHCGGECSLLAASIAAHASGLWHTAAGAPKGFAGSLRWDGREAVICTAHDALPRRTARPVTPAAAARTTEGCCDEIGSELGCASRCRDRRRRALGPAGVRSSLCLAKRFDVSSAMEPNEPASGPGLLGSLDVADCGLTGWRCAGLCKGLCRQSAHRLGQRPVCSGTLWQQGEPFPKR